MSKINNQKKHLPLSFLIVSHFRAFKHSIKEIINKPLSCLITAIVIGITLSIPAILYVLLHDFQQISKNWNEKPTISIFLKKESSMDEINNMINQLKLQKNVAAVNYISPEQGLNDLKNFSELSTVIPFLKVNPLPAVIDITLFNVNNNMQSIKGLLQSIKSSEIVDQAQIDTQWVQRLEFILSIIKRITLTLAVLLGAGVILVVSNTIRLMTQSYRNEMEILKLVGATNQYIRRPFLYHGFMYGCLGGIFAWTFTWITCIWISPPVMQLIQSYNSTFQIKSPNLLTGLFILSISAVLSITGSWLAIQQHINHQEI